ncbi:MAG: hypothetical protein S4CHLAM6_03230 [Chlamydiae bacterium]|nr:hypothetical protein [Chlamydiota bacterium]
MNYKPYQSKIRWKQLSTVITLTIAFHIYIVFLIKDISFTSYSLSIPKQNHLAEDTLDLYSQSIKKKNQDLEHIFSRLIAKSVLPHDVKFDFQDLESASFPEELTSVNPQFSPKENTYPKRDSILSSQESSLIGENNLLNSLALLESPLETTFDPADQFYAIEDQESLELIDESKNVFQQSSLIDVFDSSSMTSNLELNFEMIGLKEPTLPSSENFQSDMSKANDEKRMIASSSDFTVQVEYAPQIDADGFVFKLSLRPKPHKHFKRIKQNLFFLIDRSHSIPIKHYLAAKDAVSNALDYLNLEDSFNILIFDDKVAKLSSKNLVCSPKNIKLAKQFLKNQKHGGFFATTDLYSSLDKIVPDVVKEDEVNTAILLSDGDTYLTKQKQRKTLNYWSQKNKGKVSLFSLAIGKNKNISLLDLLSIFNKGSMRAAFSPATISNELLMLVQSLHSPIGKDLTVTGLPHNKLATLKVYPGQERLPNLYENLEYVLYGTIDQASDFTLFLQGRYYDHWLDIKKSISLSKGTLGDSQSLKKGVILQQAYGEYEQYLRSGHPGFLEKAKSLLKPVNLPLAFE